MVRFHLPILVAIVKVKTIQIGAYGIDGDTIVART
ncbi:MAG: hypothetical protein GPOALKHO_000623 [Sodalis sp.]|nr:MAG: hypothetical protein GPOALKHO_000623 [Sodalis sp.]